MPDDAQCSQPTASLGERLARLEAIFDARAALDVAAANLVVEQMAGLRKELNAINSAQKEAVSKAEAATDRRLELIGAQIEADRESANTRLQALESGVSAGRGAAEFKNSTIAWISAAAAVGLIFVSLVSAHVFG